MRAVTEFTRADGTITYRVRFRLNGKQTSETFLESAEAERFARLVDDIGVQRTSAKTFPTLTTSQPSTSVP
jgi:hypothetical protein